MGNDLSKASITKITRAIDNVFRKYELFLLATGTGATAVLLIADVFARNFFKSIYYSDELAQIFTIYTVFGGVGYAVRKARHIRMGALHDLLPYRFKKALTIAIALTSAGVMLIFSYLSVFYLIDVIEMQHRTPALNLPLLGCHCDCAGRLLFGRHAVSSHSDSEPDRKRGMGHLGTEGRI